MRGYFAIGVEGISKAMNLGSLLRTSHAFGASFFFAVAPALAEREMRQADTSDAPDHLPFYRFDSLEALKLPQRCRLVGVELSEEAVELPTFHHPTAAAYLFGPERGALSPAAVARCEVVVRIPTRFSVNLAVAGAIVMYDRMLDRGRFDRRAVGSFGPPEARPLHVRGGLKIRSRR